MIIVAPLKTSSSGGGWKWNVPAARSDMQFLGRIMRFLLRDNPERNFETYRVQVSPNLTWGRVFVSTIFDNTKNFIIHPALITHDY